MPRRRLRATLRACASDAGHRPGPPIKILQTSVLPSCRWSDLSGACGPAVSTSPGRGIRYPAGLAGSRPRWTTLTHRWRPHRSGDGSTSSGCSRRRSRTRCGARVACSSSRARRAWKSRLVAEAAAVAGRAGLVVASGAADELDELAPLASLLTALRASTRPLLPANLLEGVGELADQRLPCSTASVQVSKERAKDSPMLIVLDDLQWADSATLLALRVLDTPAGVVPGGAGCSPGARIRHRSRSNAPSTSSRSAGARRLSLSHRSTGTQSPHSSTTYSTPSQTSRSSASWTVRTATRSTSPKLVTSTFRDGGFAIDGDHVDARRAAHSSRVPGRGAPRSSEHCRIRPVSSCSSAPCSDAGSAYARSPNSSPTRPHVRTSRRGSGPRRGHRRGRRTT